ncbi:hypothetical protein [Bacillus cereus]|uniref:hypothetical protein n=1 Tax=Bacillus cereus TaxID=1396 RepID=UPI001C8C5820|nr:hypothetical protein [Bacillus cereus]MBX9158728.1 hypothetical protein [Bacillus cereus]
MGYVTQKVENVVIDAVIHNYLKHKSIRSVRSDKPECELCHHTFETTDTVNLALTSKECRSGNLFLCNTCADKAVKGGADESYLNKPGEGGF